MLVAEMDGAELVWRLSRCVVLVVLLGIGLECRAPAGEPGLSGLRIGAAWYPEQWPESEWESDVRLMEQAHFNVVRVGEFAWSTMEPSEGRYDFGWLDRAIELAAAHHIAVVLGTPTDAPPAWLTSKYPETLRVDENGVRAGHGGRRQFNYANPLYRDFCAGIVRQLALRYGHNPNVIGWQIGNEYTDESFDPATRKQFQEFLREKYKTLDNLNARWTTAYWSETYTAWSQIPLENRNGNPGLLLDHKHFVTATWRSFQDNQVTVLRSLIDARQFITTNIGGLGWSDNWDHYAITADLDLASWDDYVGQGQLDAPKNAMLNDFVRGWKNQNFWVMETEPGSVNWAPINNELVPGGTRSLAWQTVGHGADAVLYWQWRSALNGQEQYHGTIVGPDGKPEPIYAELKKLGEEFHQVGPILAGTRPRAEIALLHTYDSRWAIDFQPHTSNYDQEQVLLRFYAPLQRIAESQGESIDIVDPQRVSLAKYKFLVAPSLNVIDDALAQKLTAWVNAGGHLLLGPRSGMKDDFDALNIDRQPGPLVDVLGAKVEQFYALDADLGLVGASDAQTRQGNLAGRADIWAEELRPLSSEAKTALLYRDPGGWLESKPAMVVRRYGAGVIAYLGTLPDQEILASLLREQMPSLQKHQTKLADIPEGSPVELCVREAGAEAGRRRVYIVMNHSGHGEMLTLHRRVRSVLEGVQIEHGADASGPEDTIVLPPEGVAVLVPEAQ